MRLSAVEHYTENIGRLFGPSKRRYMWVLRRESVELRVELHVSHLSGKHRLFVNEELVAMQGGSFCGQELLSARFHRDEFAVKPLSASSQDYELEANGISFSRLFEIAERESALSLDLDLDLDRHTKRISSKFLRTPQPLNLNKSDFGLGSKTNPKALPTRKPSQPAPPLSKKTSQSASSSNEIPRKPCNKSLKGTTQPVKPVKTVKASTRQPVNSSAAQPLNASRPQPPTSFLARGVTEPVKFEGASNEFSLFNLSAPKRRMICFESEIHKPTVERFEIVRSDMPAPLAIDSLVVPKAMLDAAMRPLQSDILPNPEYFPTGSDCNIDACREVYADSE